MDVSLSGASLPWQQPQLDRLLASWHSGRLPHAWLFIGSAGSGKLAFMRRFGNLLLCRQPQAGQPCGTCQDCRLLLAGTHPDWLLLQPEGKQLKVDQIREAIDFAQNTAQRAGVKLIVLQPAEALNANAANALLKMLEEPPPSTYFFLLGEQPGLLLPTLRSRCQRLVFTTPAAATALEWLQTAGLSGSDAALCLTLARGAPLQAMALARQGAAAGFQRLLQTLQSLLEGRSTAVQAARHCEDLGITAAIDYQLLGLSALLLNLQAAQPLALSELQPLQQQLQPRSGLALLRRLHAVQQRLQAARRLALATNNANPLLVLEALFADWCQLASAAASS